MKIGFGWIWARIDWISKRRFVSRSMKNGKKSIRLNPKHQSRSTLARIYLNRNVNQNQSEWTQGWNDSDWKRGSNLFGLIPRIKSDWLLPIFHQTRHKTFFGLVRNDLLSLGYRFWNSSDWLEMNSYPKLSPRSFSGGGGGGGLCNTTLLSWVRIRQD